MYHKLQQGTEPSFTVPYWLTLHSKDHLRQHTIFIYKVFCNALVTVRRFLQSFVLCPSSLHLGKDRFKDLVWIKGRGEKSTMKIFICYLHLTSASPCNLGRSMAPQNWAGEGPVTHHHIKDGQLVAGFSWKVFFENPDNALLVKTVNGVWKVQKVNKSRHLFLTQ